MLKIIIWKGTLPFLLLVAHNTGAALPPSPQVSRQNLPQQPAELALPLSAYETRLSGIEAELAQIRQEETSLKKELDYLNQYRSKILHYLRHTHSSLGVLLSGLKPEEIVHAGILVRAVMPALHHRMEYITERITILSPARIRLETQQEGLRNAAFRAHQEESLKQAPVDREAALLTQEKGPENASETVPLADSVQKPLILIPPVAGKLLPSFGSSKPDWEAFRQGVLWIPHPGATVACPLSGTIAYAGNHTENQGKTVIVQAAHTHIILSGLGTLTCSEGQSVKAGASIGRMPVSHGRLYMEMWHQEQTVDPRLFLPKKRVKP